MNLPNSSVLGLICVFILFGAAKALPQKEKRGKEKVTGPGETRQEIEAQFIEALQEKITGNYKTSLALFAAFVRKYPEIAAGHYEFGELSALNGIYSQALPAFQRAVELEPNNKWYRVRLAEMYDFLKMYKEARETYKKLSEMYPKELEYALSAASILVDEGRLSEALALLDKVEQQIGVTQEINLEKYRLFMAQKKFNEALKELEKLQKAYPKETLYFGMAAEVYFSKGDKKKALEMFETILKNDPSNTLIHLSLAEYYRKEKDPAKSFYHLEKAFENPLVEMDKKMMVLLSLLEEVKNSEEYSRQADTLTRILTEVHPEDPKSWSIRGDFFLEKKRWREALGAFRRVLSLEKSKFIFYRQCFQLARRLEDYGELKKIAEEAEELFPVQPEISLYKGLALLKTGKLSEAGEVISYGKEMVIDNPELTAEFQTASAMLSAAGKDNAEAENRFEKAVATYGKSAYIRAEYARFLTETGKFDKALVQAEEAIKLSPETPEGYLAKAGALFKSGKSTEAEDVMAAGLKVGAGEIKRAVMLYADILESNGNKAGAEEIRKQAEK